MRRVLPVLTTASEMERAALRGASERSTVLEPPRESDAAYRPIYAVWEITLRCDLACAHCGSRAGKSRPDELTTEEALDLVDQLAGLGIREVSLIGGEAYLRPDWLDIARRVKERGMLCGVVTGGRGLTLERARAAKDAGVDGVSVSIDGLEASHDALRGVQGSFEQALAALEHLATVDLSRAVNTQINRVNSSEVEAVFDLVSARGIYAWQVQFTVAMGRAADNPAILLEPYDLLELMPRLAELERRARELGIKLWPGNNVGYFGPFESVFRRNNEGSYHEPCTAGRSTLGLEANGDIKGCPSLPTRGYAGGNIRDASLKDIWERSAALRFARDRDASELWGRCASCYYKDECLAGCSWTAHVLFGKRGNNPFCHHRALELLLEGKRERLVRVHPPPGAPFDYGQFELVEEDWPADELSAVRELVRRTSPGAID
ncbi:MAG: radical SAM protein [Polyangiaceae bacterium]